MEESIGKLPKFLKSILITSGYDCKSALQVLDEQSIIDIEEFVQTNRGKFAEILKDTKYENITLFKFRPGHRKLIINLPKHLNLVKKTHKETNSTEGRNDIELKANLLQKISNYGK